MDMLLAVRLTAAARVALIGIKNRNGPKAFHRFEDSILKRNGVDRKMPIPPKLAMLANLMDGLGTMLGLHFELILHDLHDLGDLSHTVVSVVGNVTGRSVGSPATNFLADLLNKFGNEAQDSINYRNVTRKGQILRSTTMFIRDEEDHIIGSLCINQDLSMYLEASRLLQTLTAIQSEDGNEVFPKDIADVKNAAEKVLSDYPKPLAYQRKKDRITQMLELNSLGFFELTDSVKILAQHFGVNPTTIYLYLREIRSSKQ